MRLFDRFLRDVARLAPTGHEASAERASG
jgi:hypothetical protein